MTNASCSVLIALALGLVAACDCGTSHGPDAATGDAGEVVDASGPPDAQRMDASDPDASEPRPDAGPVGCEPDCERTCEEAESRSSHVGCRFVAVDLDNAAIAAGRDASAQQYGLVVINPQPNPVEVWVEVDDGAPDEPLAVRELMRVTIDAGDDATLRLPRREVDGSSETGLDDGTGTALTRNAYRLGAERPVAVYQFNPLSNDAGVFSNDATLILPEHGLGTRYTVVGWPQTVADDEDPARDFDPDRDDEDLRSFLTVVGTAEDTRVTVRLGNDVVATLGAPGIPAGAPGDTRTVTLGPLDVLNLETDGYGASFTGTVVEATAPVAVFTGTEAAAAPFAATLADTPCCADHMESQLLSDDRLGSHFVIVRSVSRIEAINRALVAGRPLDEKPPRDLVRLLPVEDGTTTVRTTLPPPRDLFELARGEVLDLVADDDFLIDADRPVSVIEVLPSQLAVDLPSTIPAGDPAMFVVPAERHHRRHQAFGVPDTYAFDYLIAVGPVGARFTLDGGPLPEDCERRELSGFGRAWVTHQCPLSTPRFDAAAMTLEPGEQGDGAHVLEADADFGVVVHGFDFFVSYAYGAGMDPRPR